jgi:two-component system sensor histidine kinase AlgZ
VEPSARGGRLRVLTELRGTRVVVRITNTLPPRAGRAGDEGQPRGHGIALANVRARLALLHDVQGEFTAGVEDGLYQVRVTLPAPASSASRHRRSGAPGSPSRRDSRASRRRGITDGAGTSPAPDAFSASDGGTHH